MLGSSKNNIKWYIAIVWRKNNRLEWWIISVIGRVLFWCFFAKLQSKKNTKITPNQHFNLVVHTSIQYSADDITRDWWWHHKYIMQCDNYDVSKWNVICDLLNIDFMCGLITGCLLKKLSNYYFFIRICTKLQQIKNICNYIGCHHSHSILPHTKHSTYTIKSLI